MTNLNASDWPLHSYAQHSRVWLVIMLNAVKTTIKKTVANWADINSMSQSTLFITFIFTLFATAVIYLVYCVKLLSNLVPFLAQAPLNSDLCPAHAPFDSFRFFFCICHDLMRFLLYRFSCLGSWFSFIIVFCHYSLSCMLFDMAFNTITFFWQWTFWVEFSWSGRVLESFWAGNRRPNPNLATLTTFPISSESRDPAKAPNIERARSPTVHPIKHVSFLTE